MPHGNLMSSMTCLIGLPRCGSQYIASLFKTNSSYNIKNISEPFTPNHKSSLDIMDINIDEFNTYEEQVTVVIDRLKSISKHQSLILKLFLHSWTLRFVSRSHYSGHTNATPREGGSRPNRPEQKKFPTCCTMCFVA